MKKTLNYAAFIAFLVAIIIAGWSPFLTETNAQGITYTPGQKTMARSMPVVIASDQSTVHVTVDNGTPTNTDAATHAAGTASIPETSADLFGFNGTAYTRVILDACEANVQTANPINISSATTTRIIPPSASKKNYICGMTLSAAGADNVALIEGTGGSCGTGTAGMAGGITAASGFNFLANQAYIWQAGKVAHFVTAGTNVDTCLTTSAAVQLSGVVKYAQQ